LKVAAIAGSPTFTTDPSTKARLEARMVEAKIQFGCRALHVDANLSACAPSHWV